MNGLLRYNAIQSALSSVRKEKGWKLHVGGFQDIASKVYHSTKDQPLKQVINNIDILVEDIPKQDTPLLPSELHEDFEFYCFDEHAKSQCGIKFSALIPDNLYVKSPQLWEPDLIVDASHLNYIDHFKQFSDYCNANKGVWWHDSGDAPVWRLTEPEYDWNEQKWLTTIELGDEQAYGYYPGREAERNEDFSPTEAGPKPEPEKEEPPKETIKPSEKELEIKKIQAETAKVQASKEKLSELNKAIKNLDSQLKRKLITKKQYGKFLERLYDM